MICNSCNLKRVLPGKDKEKYNSEAVNFWLKGILFFFYDFWSCTTGTSYKTFGWIFVLNSKSKVNNARFIVVCDKNILRFDIPMKNRFIFKVTKSADQLLSHIFSLLLGEIPFVKNPLQEISVLKIGHTDKMASGWVLTLLLMELTLLGMFDKREDSSVFNFFKYLYFQLEDLIVSWWGLINLQDEHFAVLRAKVNPE